MIIIINYKIIHIYTYIMIYKYKNQELLDDNIKITN